ncbi:hypothetical protein B0T14DRAFT_11537 [Immersiella caudata]|uniref:Uncharacterized protein n=1 Tax=Immersiella caudata TaxID=314043 RepID=A0AA39XDT0_9PEZI|nr:hypothetical protein B0T14DRAFT_11537 [Immersiella caudata]
MCLAPIHLRGTTRRESCGKPGWERSVGESLLGGAQRHSQKGPASCFNHPSKRRTVPLLFHAAPIALPGESSSLQGAAGRHLERLEEFTGIAIGRRTLRGGHWIDGRNGYSYDARHTFKLCPPVLPRQTLAWQHSAAVARKHQAISSVRASIGRADGQGKKESSVFSTVWRAGILPACLHLSHLAGKGNLEICFGHKTFAYGWPTL